MQQSRTAAGQATHITRPVGLLDDGRGVVLLGTFSADVTWSAVRTALDEAAEGVLPALDAA